LIDLTVAGMPLVCEADDIAVPLAAVVVIKGLDADGDIAYWSCATENLKTTEALGMAVGLVDDLRNQRRES
jgi:hypothetical protein